jgi:hypothetical protein
MRLKTALALALGTSIPLPALALDCAVPSFTRDFWSAQNSAEVYEVVYGRFSNGHNATYDQANDVVFWDATFEGFRASSTAFDLPLTTSVRIEDYLFSDIAGGARAANTTQAWMDGLEGVVFLRQSPAGYRISTELCDPFIYVEPENIAQALDCVNRRRCPRE